MRTRAANFLSFYFNPYSMPQPPDLVVGDAVYYARERAVGLIWAATSAPACSCCSATAAT